MLMHRREHVGRSGCSWSARELERLRSERATKPFAFHSTGVYLCPRRDFKKRKDPWSKRV